MDENPTRHEQGYGENTKHKKKNAHSENNSPNCVGHKNGACNSERRNTCFAILDVISSREKILSFLNCVVSPDHP